MISKPIGTKLLKSVAALAAFIFILFFFCGGLARAGALQEAQTLQGEFNRLCKQNRFQDALPVAEKILALRQRVLGRSHPAIGLALSNLANVYTKLEDHRKAQALNQQAVDIFEKTLGAEHPTVANCLTNLALNYAALKNTKKAESLHQRALSIREKAFGPVHADVANSLINLANIYRSQQKNTKARQLYERALEIRIKILGPDHPDLAYNLDDLAAVDENLESYARAESLRRRALAVRQKALGLQHPETAQSLINLARNCQVRGNYWEAESLYLQAIKIQKRFFGNEHPVVARSQYELAVVYASMGENDNALLLLQKSLAVMKKSQGPETLEVANILQLMAGVYNSLGEYDRQEPLLQRSLAIDKKVLGPDHPSVAADLNNLAAYYQLLQNPAKAMQIYNQSLAVTEKCFGTEHMAVAVNLTNQADVHKYLGEFAEAEDLLERSRAITEKIFGPDSPQLTPVLNNLADVCSSRGRYDRAESLYRKVLDIFDQNPSANPRLRAISINNLAEIYCRLGQTAKAAPLYQKSLAILKKNLSEHHPLLVGNLINQGSLNAALSDYQKALQYYQQAARIDDKLIDLMMGFTSEKQKIRFLSNQFISVYSYISLVSQHMLQNPSAPKDALELWLKRKGLALEANRNFQSALFSSTDSRTSKMYQELCRLRTGLSKTLLGGPGKEALKAHREKIKKLEDQKEKIEMDLARRCRPYALKLKKAAIETKDLAAALPAKSALIEFARIRMYNFHAKADQKLWLEPHYLAFILHKDRPDDIRLIDLGPADVIDRAIAAYKRKLFSQSKLQTLRAIRPEGLDSEAPAQELYTLLFKPLRDHLGNNKSLFVSPDGNLNLLPFETILTPQGRYLVEDYSFNYLASGRDLIDFGSIQTATAKSMIIGNPDFNLVADDSRKSMDIETLNAFPKFKLSRIPDIAGIRFEPLPGTATEVQAIQALLGQDKADLYAGDKARETVLFQCSGPKYLHLATHGFFLQDQDMRRLTQDGRELKNFETTSDTSRLIRVGNPLVRSGFALAGANSALKQKGSLSGIMTAEKVLNLDLRGTRMVVLSACETGLGDIRAGEGVFGLRRAFSTVGAASLVMSLWPVPDRETRELMIQFYKNIMSGSNRCQALRRAALKQMDIVNNRYGNKNPFFWGAFIFMGQP